jgi:hypothetical protein
VRFRNCGSLKFWPHKVRGNSWRFSSNPVQILWPDAILIADQLWSYAGE